MSTAAPARPRKLSAAQARQLAKATARAQRAKAVADAAKRELDDLHARFKPLLPPSADPKDAGKDVLQAEAGGFLVRVSTFEGGEYFSLKDYREAGGTITEEMQPYVHRGDPRERWTVKDLRGPKDPEAVNPAM